MKITIKKLKKQKQKKKFDYKPHPFTEEEVHIGPTASTKQESYTEAPSFDDVQLYTNFDPSSQSSIGNGLMHSPNLPYVLVI